MHKGEEKYNSYTRDHQKSGSHQFCQSFALLGACASSAAEGQLHKRGKTMGSLFEALKPGAANHGANIRVVVTLWDDYFQAVEADGSEVKEWFFNCVNEVNDYLLESQEEKPGRKTLNSSVKMKPIAEKGVQITMKLLREKLKDISQNADLIAKFV